ncbi:MULTISPECIES: hypothetical protein [unclassified Amycolatopsis]|uniref:hypothetical protein n=1 Tax=unclassified Amycolatopsis TaxID=2618356 RepID=UPI001C6A45FD|nr:hypothetical protein [Amycolatopsis sp. DSM 110486]QYN19198.1 hypothetical protein K1T34_42210 [Amycolatopsis sp. DSM 110486]
MASIPVYNSGITWVDRYRYDLNLDATGTEPNDYSAPPPRLWPKLSHRDFTADWSGHWSHDMTWRHTPDVARIVAFALEQV